MGRTPQPILAMPDHTAAHQQIAKWTKWVAAFTAVLAAATIISTYFIMGAMEGCR